MAIQHLRPGIDGMDFVHREKEVARCDARNWTPPSNQCGLKTHWVCDHCDRRTCGVHASWHQGDFANQCAQQFRFVRRTDG